MNTTLRTSRHRTLATGGVIAVTALAVTTVFISSAGTQPDESAQELPVESVPSEEKMPLNAHEPHLKTNLLTDRLLQQENPAGESEESFIPLPPNHEPPPELHVESFTEEENALLNSDEPTHVEIDSLTGDVISIEKRDNASIPAEFGGSVHE